MTEDKQVRKINNSGFSLIELIIVLAIVAVVTGTVVWSVSLVFSTDAKACANNLQRAIADCKVTTMGKAKAWLLIYRGEDGRVYSQLHVMTEKKDDAGNRIYDETTKDPVLVDVPEEAQKLGGNRVMVTYTDASGNSGVNLPEGKADGNTGIRIEFDRSSGSFKEDAGVPQKIELSGGKRHYTFTFHMLTGKVTVKRTD